MGTWPMPPTWRGRGGGREGTGRHEVPRRASGRRDRPRCRTGVLAQQGADEQRRADGRYPMPGAVALVQRC